MEKIENILSDLIKINSVFPKEKYLALYLEKTLRRLGFDVKKQYLSKDRWNIVSSIGTGSKTIMLYAHMDTVPAYSGWSRPPFLLTENASRYFGRGVLDMKGAIAVFLTAVSELKNINVNLVFVLGVDEENISEGAFAFCRKFRRKIDLVVSLASDAYSGDWPDPFVLTLGRQGRAAVSLMVPGKSAHGADSKAGVNSINQAAKFILALEKMPMLKHQKLGQSSLFVRNIKSHAGSLSVPEQTEIMIDYHTVLPENTTLALERIKNFVDSQYENDLLESTLKSKYHIGLIKRKTPYLEPFITSCKHYLVKVVISFLRNKYGSCNLHYGASVADENIFAEYLNCPVICLGPVGGNAHGADEWVCKNSMQELKSIYKGIICTF